MANVKINDLAFIADPASTDVLPIVDVTLDTTNKISIADILKTAPEGTAAAPAIAFEGDSNTGIYHPGSEQIGFATSGLGRLFIASDGNIGVGTAAPGYALEVLKASPTYNRVAQFTSDSTVSLIAFGGSNGTGEFAPEIGQDNSTLVFNTQNQERMRIDVNGRLLVGTSSSITTLVEAGLQVQGTGADGYASLGRWSVNAANPGLIFNKSRGASVGTRAIVENNDNLGEITFTGDNGSAFIAAARIQCQVDGTPAGPTPGPVSMPGRLVFSTTAGGATTPSPRMTIDSDGKVGIGTTGPTVPLEIVGPANKGFTQGYNVRIQDDSTSAQGVGGGISFVGKWNSAVSTAVADFALISGVKENNTQGDFGGALILGTRTNGTGAVNTEKMRITSTGNVGIGTTSPGKKLSVVDTSGVEPVIITAEPGASPANFDASQFISFFRNTALTGLTFGAADNRLLTGTLDSDNTVSFRANKVGLVASDYIKFTTGAGERARIDSDGRLLVGTSSGRLTSTVNWLSQIEGLNLTGLGITSNSANANGAYLSLAKSRGTAVGSNNIVADNDLLGGILFSGADGTDANTQGALIGCYVDGTPGADDMPGRLVFSTTADGASTPTERMDIKSDGRQRNFSSSAAIFEAVSSQAPNTSNFIFVGKSGATALGSGNNAFFVFTNGDVQNSNNSYGAISDIKLKENIVDASSQWDDLKALQVRNYNFKEGQTHTQIGLVAQEVELVSPGLVSETPDRDDEGNDLGTVTKSVNYSVLYMKAVKALQEAMERIETLEQRLTDAGIS